jgi:hypothetical protein
LITGFLSDKLLEAYKLAGNKNESLQKINLISIRNKQKYVKKK